MFGFDFQIRMMGLSRLTNDTGPPRFQRRRIAPSSLARNLVNITGGIGRILAKNCQGIETRYVEIGQGNEMACTIEIAPEIEMKPGTEIEPGIETNGIGRDQGIGMNDHPERDQGIGITYRAASVETKTLLTEKYPGIETNGTERVLKIEVRL